MAVYAISDIHGALDEFERLLKKMDFHYDGSDSLYLLGDFGDWGEKSIETLLFVKKLDEQYDFVHCVMGNHEMMFLNTVDAAGNNKPEGDEAENWLLNNRGLITWEGYRALEKEERRSLVDWMRNLRLSFDVHIGTLTFMLAHAYPYYYDMQYPEKEAKRRKQEAVWRRLLVRENPFADYRGKNHYDYLICGHTISDYYFQELRSERNWPYRMPTQAMRNRIFRGESFIDIDCGAKCMDVEDGAPDQMKVASLRAQLAALRLDDMEGFYVHRPVVRVPEVEELQVPDIRIPVDARTGESGIPELRLPEVRFPELRLPENMTFFDIIQEAGTNVKDAYEDSDHSVYTHHRRG